MSIIKCAEAKMATYRIGVKTGDEAGAGTRANVYIQLIGSMGKTDHFHLSESTLLYPRPDGFFKLGQQDVFEFQNVPDIGEVLQVKIWHDNTGPEPAWYLGGVGVRTSDYSDPADEAKHYYYYFNCDQWLAADGQICRLLQKPRPKALYQIAVKTSDQKSVAKSSTVYIKLIGTTGETDFLKLERKETDSEGENSNSFVFPDVTVVGEVMSIKIWREEAGCPIDEVVVKVKDHLNSIFNQQCYYTFVCTGEPVDAKKAEAATWQQYANPKKEVHLSQKFLPAIRREAIAGLQL